MPRLLLCLAVILATAAPSWAAKKRVVTTFTIIAEMAQNVAGDKADVTSITKPGAEIHGYEPTPGDIVKALAAGASSVMMGSMLAGTEESPGESFLLEGRRFKMIRGMGSLSAMQDGSADRYFQEGEMSPKKLVHEGIEGRVPYNGPVGDVLFHMVGGQQAGIGYVGCGSIDELRTDAQFVRITSAGLRESHPHDVTITREAPNYSL